MSKSKSKTSKASKKSMDVYVPKNPERLLKAEGFSPIASDDGFPMFSKFFGQTEVIISYDDPPSDDGSSGITIMVKLTRSAYTTYFADGNFRSVIDRIPEYIESAVRNK